MPELVVTNPNILVDASLRQAHSGRTIRARRARTEAEAGAVHRLHEIRREVEELVCSSTWAEDCYYRGADYSPDFKCDCPACRNEFPDRRYPRPVRESNYSDDCQLEAEEDPEFAEEISRLRNDRQRLGSVFIARSIDS
jgi:hypothetical protein